MILLRWDFGSHHCPSSVSVRNLYKAQLRRQYFVVTQCGESENENHRRSDDDSGSCRTLGNFCDHSKAGVLRTKGAPASFQRRRGVPQVRPHMADNEGRHGAPVWERKRIAGRKVGRSWRPESPLNENETA